MPISNPDRHKNAYTHKLTEKDRGERRTNHGVKSTSWVHVALAVLAVAALIGLIFLLGHLIGG